VPLPSKQPGPERRSPVRTGGSAWWTWFLFAGGLLLVGGVAAAWVEWVPIQAWVSVQALAQAGEADRDAWAERVAGLDEAAVPGLIACLGRGDRRVCANAEPALRRVADRWTGDDPRRAALAGSLAEAFPRLSEPGQEVVLRLQTAWAAGGAPAGPAVRLLLKSAAHSAEPAVHAQALELAALALDGPDQAAVRDDCRELTQACLRHPDAATRLRAIQVAVHPRLGLLEQVLRLLNDPAAEVRREAMLAARSAPEALMKTESLLRWLHDPDEDVRRLCEAVLRGRNLSEKHLQLGRLLTDDRAAVRLQVLRSLRTDSDLEPGVWLRLLSIDPEPAVRVAAVRAAVADPRVDLSDRLDQMIQSDPSPTVSQLARYYLSCQLRRKPSSFPSSRPH
jgi:hypothetical protein